MLQNKERKKHKQKENTKKKQIKKKQNLMIGLSDYYDFIHFSGIVIPL